MLTTDAGMAPGLWYPATVSRAVEDGGQSGEVGHNLPTNANMSRMTSTRPTPPMP